MENKIFNVKELMEYLHCSESTVRKLTREKAIPHFRVEKKILFQKTKIDEWIETKTVDSDFFDTGGQNGKQSEF